MKHKKRMFRDEYHYKDEETIYNEDDIYSEAHVNDMIEWDEISDEEAGFMIGYLQEED